MSSKAKTTSLTLPLGIAGQEPSNAEVGSLAYATDTEKVRVKQVAGWADAGGGGGGSVTSVTTATSSVVTITNPAGPVVNIDVTIPAAVTSVTTSTPGLLTITNPSGPAVDLAVTAQPVLSPYLSLPPSPSSFNEEFNTSQADLAALGWTIINADTGAAFTRLGTVDFTAYWAGVAVVSGTNYRSSVFNGQLFLQVPDNTSIFVYKTSPGVGTYSLRGHVYTHGAVGSSLDPNSLGLLALRGSSFASFTSFVLAANNRNASSHLQQAELTTFDNVAPVVATAASVLSSQDVDLVVMRVGPSTGGAVISADMRVMNASSGLVHATCQGGSTIGSTLVPDKVGWFMKVRALGSAAPTIVCIDYIRYFTGTNAWIIS